MVVYACNPCTQEGDVGGSQVQGQPGLHNEFQVSLVYKARLYQKSINHGSACNPSYSGGRDQDDHGLNSGQAKPINQKVNKKILQPNK
jgi:hypothetical protein